MNDWLLILLLGFLLGWIARSLLEREPRNGPYEQRIELAVGHDTWILRSIDHDRLRALASRFAAGRPMTFASLTGAGKLFSKAEWIKVRREMINSGIFTVSRNGVLLPTPQGRQILVNLARGTNARERTPAHGAVVRWR